jgi:hypothetical protein
MTLTRPMFMLLLEPKLSNIWNEAYPLQPVEWTSFLNVRSTKKAQLTDFKLTGFGPLRLKGEGEPIIYDDPIPGQPVVYTPVRFALGYKVTQEVIDHELYGQVEKLERELMKSAVEAQETTAILFFNNGFVTTDADGFEATGFDGLATFSTAHTRLDGGAVQRNRPSTDVDFGLTGLQNALIDFDRLKDDRGRPQFIKPKRVFVSPEDRFTAKEILESEYKPGTANNEVNALKDAGLSFQVLHRLDDPDAWFVQGDTHDANFVWDIRPRSGMEEDFDMEIIKRKVVEGFAVGHGEWRGNWGSSGAG